MAVKAFVAGMRASQRSDGFQEIIASFHVVESAASALVPATDGNRYSQVAVQLVYSDTPASIRNKIALEIRELYGVPALTVVFVDAGS